MQAFIILTSMVHLMILVWCAFQIFHELEHEHYDHAFMFVCIALVEIITLNLVTRSL